MVAATKFVGKGAARSDDVSRMKKLVVKKLKRGEYQLPFPDGIVLRIHNLVSNPRTNPSEISEVIRADPVLAAYILKIANSPVYGGYVECKDISQAIMRIGLKSLEGIVITLSSKNLFRFKEPMFQSLMKEVWEHSLICGAVTHWAADQIMPSEKEISFLAGLLHDLGKLPVLQVISQIYRHSQGRFSRDGIVEIMDGFHQPVGAALLKKWKASPLAVEVAAHHHAPDQADGSKRLVYLVSLVDNLSYLAEFDAEAAEDHEVREIMEFLALKEEKVRAIETCLATVTEEINQWA